MKLTADEYILPRKLVERLLFFVEAYTQKGSERWGRELENTFIEVLRRNEESMSLTSRGAVRRVSSKNVPSPVEDDFYNVLSHEEEGKEGPV